MKKDIYQTITNRFIADLEKGVRPWMKPWSVENVAGRISLPLRSNGVPYRGINILMLWSQAIEKGYYATVAHELTHWTRHKTRLDREFGRKRWGDEGYAAEELVAELGSAFLCADLELRPEVRDDHASYIANWLQLWRGEHNSSNREESIM